MQLGYRQAIHPSQELAGNRPLVHPRVRHISRFKLNHSCHTSQCLPSSVLEMLVKNSDKFEFSVG
uniref:Uncharacterized protein n=1 Tax=Anguilla anguilla TaxID=7936 RepID=A0A0E9TR12_ANGAN